MSDLLCAAVPQWPSMVIVMVDRPQLPHQLIFGIIHQLTLLPVAHRSSNTWNGGGMEMGTVTSFGQK